MNAEQDIPKRFTSAHAAWCASSTILLTRDRHAVFSKMIFRMTEGFLARHELVTLIGQDGRNPLAGSFFLCRIAALVRLFMMRILSLL